MQIVSASFQSGAKISLHQCLGTSVQATVREELMIGEARIMAVGIAPPQSVRLFPAWRANGLAISCVCCPRQHSIFLSDILPGLPLSGRDLEGVWVFSQLWGNRKIPGEEKWEMTGALSASPLRPPESAWPISNPNQSSEPPESRDP